MTPGTYAPAAITPNLRRHLAGSLLQLSFDLPDGLFAEAHHRVHMLEHIAELETGRTTGLLQRVDAMGQVRFQLEEATAGRLLTQRLRVLIGAQLIDISACSPVSFSPQMLSNPSPGCSYIAQDSPTFSVQVQPRRPPRRPFRRGRSWRVCHSESTPAGA